MRALPAGAVFLGLLVVLRHFVDAQRSGQSVDQAGIRVVEPYLHSASIANYFADLQRADLIQRAESGGWVLTRSLDSTDLLRVYRHTDYRLPLHPQEEAATLGIDLPPELLALLAELAGVLAVQLGTRLAQVYPPAAGIATDATEIPA
jgi:membrane protein